MPTAEHTISHMLRNAGDVIADVEQHDVVLHRRDGEDLFLGLRSREHGVRESVGILAHLLRHALHDDSTRTALAEGVTESLAWTSFLPDHEREKFLVALATTAATAYEIDSYEPLARELSDWKATAETYALGDVVDQFVDHHAGPAVPLAKPLRRV